MRPLKNMMEYAGIEAARLEAMEERLKKDVLAEVSTQYRIRTCLIWDVARGITHQENHGQDRTLPGESRTRGTTAPHSVPAQTFFIGH